jgi:hypothetical protein
VNSQGMQIEHVCVRLAAAFSLLHFVVLVLPSVSLLNLNTVVPNDFTLATVVFFYLSLCR